MILYVKVLTSTCSSQTLGPYKHWLRWPKTNDPGGFSMNRNRWQCSQWPKNRWPWRVLDDCSFPSHRTETRIFTEKKQEYLQNRTRIFQWPETSEARMTRRWWCGTDLMKLQQMNGSPWTAMGALQHNKPKKGMAISRRVYVGCWRFLYQTNRLDA